MVIKGVHRKKSTLPAVQPVVKPEPKKEQKKSPKKRGPNKDLDIIEVSTEAIDSKEHI